MGNFDTKSIRNVAVLGHGGEGKTTLCEAILYNAKAIDRQGKVPEGNTVMDFDEQEIARQISMSLSCAYAVWQGAKINLIDIPGFFDFEGEAVQALSAADCGVIVVSAGGVVPVGCEKAVKRCTDSGLPMMIFINQMDKENADYIGTVHALQEKYPNKIAPISIPVMEGSKMKGFINVLEKKAYEFGPQGLSEIPVPANLEGELSEILEKMVETAAENDDELLEKFFSGETLTQEEIQRGIRAGISAEKVIPLLAGSAFQNRGVFNLMDAIIGMLPAPDFKGKVTGKNSKGEPVEVKISADAPFSAQIFKTIADPFVGKLNLFKVISGSIRSGATVSNTTREKSERINSILLVRGKKQESVDEISCGDIGAFAKLQNTGTGDTLCDPSLDVRFADFDFPQPVLSMSITSVKTGDEDKVFTGLRRLAEEDPTFTVAKNADTNETLISGMGETHLETICKKLKSKFNTEAMLKTPKVPYRETIRKTVQAEGKHKKQSGGHGQYGHCKIRFEYFPDGVFEFAEEVVGGTVPKQYIPAVEKGLRECLHKGVLAGCPVVNLRAVLYDGSYHDVDSSEESFKVASHLAFRDGLKNANPVLLEPIYALNIKVPENYIGDIMGDLNKRRGRILGMDAQDGYQIISAEAPLAEIFRYATDLRSMTQGRGAFSMQEARYEEVPAALQQKVVAELGAEKN